MSSAGRTQIVDVTYDDPRTGQRVWERKIQEVPYEEIEEIRGQELALLRSPRARARPGRRDERDYSGGRAYDDLYASRQRPRERLAPPADDRYGSRDDRRSADRQLDGKRADGRDRRRRDESSESDSESSRERRHRHRHRRAKSEQGANREQDGDGEDDGRRLWYSGKARKDAKWHERNFDSHYDGLIAAAAGAAMGAMTAKHFAGQENRGAKMAGGALAGAAAFNLAENKYRLYTEEKEEEKERQGRRKKTNDVTLDQPMQLGGQMLAGGMVPGM